MDTIETIEHDGYIGKIHVDDEGRSEPDHDGVGHVYVAWHHPVAYEVELKHADYGSTREAELIQDALNAAFERWGTDWETIERYLRAYFDVIALDYDHWDRDGNLILVVTRGLADAWGCTEEHLAQHPDVSLTSGMATWQAYRDGEVYGYTVETENGEHIDSCWGYYGDAELPYIRSLIEDAIKDHRADVHAERVELFRKLVTPSA